MEGEVNVERETSCQSANQISRSTVLCSDLQRTERWSQGQALTLSQPPGSSGRSAHHVTFTASQGVQHRSSCFWCATGKTKSKTKPLHRGRCSPTASSQRRSDGWPLKDANVREAADLPQQTSSQRQRRDASKSASGCSGRPCRCQLRQLHIHHLHLQIQQQHRRRPSIHPPPARNLHTPHQHQAGQTSARGPYEAHWTF